MVYQWTFSTQNRQTVSPLRLNLSSTTSAPESPKVQTPEQYDSKFDLTDRDSVRQLMVAKKQAADELNSALDDAMAEFGN